MNGAGNIVTTTRALVDDGAGLLDAFRAALDKHPTTKANRTFAARLLTIGHRRALVQLCELIDERDEAVVQEGA